MTDKHNPLSVCSFEGEFMNDYSIRIANLTKSYGNLRALDGITFDVMRGTLFAFLGENGAGKSTTINIMCGQLQKDGGTVLEEKRLAAEAAALERRLEKEKEKRMAFGCVLLAGILVLIVMLLFVYRRKKRRFLR